MSCSLAPCLASPEGMAWHKVEYDRPRTAQCGQPERCPALRQPRSYASRHDNTLTCTLGKGILLPNTLVMLGAKPEQGQDTDTNAPSAWQRAMERLPSQPAPHSKLNTSAAASTAVTHQSLRLCEGVRCSRITSGSPSFRSICSSPSAWLNAMDRKKPITAGATCRCAVCTSMEA